MSCTNVTMSIGTSSDVGKSLEITQSVSRSGSSVYRVFCGGNGVIDGNQTINGDVASEIARIMSSL